MTRANWFLIASLLGCAAQPKGDGADSSASPNATSGVALDTLRGELHIVGSEPATQLLLRTANSNVTLAIDRGSLLWRADGTDVCVRIQRDRQVIVRGYSVRAIGGHAAVDGVVRITGDSAMLERPGAEALPLGSTQANSDLAADARAALSSAATVVLGRPLLAVDSLSNSCDRA